MTRRRVLSLVALTLVAAPWAVLLGAAGLWFIFSGPSQWPGAGAACVIGGITLCMAGQVVFTVCIADRYFPRGGRVAGWLVEIPSCLMLIAGCLWLCWAFLGVLLDAPVS